MKVDVVLLNYRRPHNIPKIIEHLDSELSVGRFIVWDNSGLENSPRELHESIGPRPNVSICRMSDLRNVGTLGRYFAGRIARRPIYTQDDDYLSLDAKSVVEMFDWEHICASLPNENGSHHYKYEWMQSRKPWIQLGFGSVYLHRWAETAVSAWEAKYGTCNLLQSKFDRIFTVLHEKHLATLGRLEKLVDPDGGLSDSSGDAIWKQPGHRKLVHEAVEKARAIMQCTK